MAGPPAAATDSPTIGGADLRRRAASLVVGVALLRLRHSPRSLRGLQLGPAQGTRSDGVDSGTFDVCCTGVPS